MDGGYFDDQDIFTKPPGDLEVDIAIEAVDINFMGVLLALDSVREGWPGAECSGVITRIGSSVTEGW